MSRINPTVEIINLTTMKFIGYSDMQRAIATVIVERIMMYLLTPTLHEQRHYDHGSTIPQSTGDILALFVENYTGD